MPERLSDVQAALNEIEQRLRALRRLAPQLDREARDTARGYPTNTDHGIGRGGIGDPTGQAVIAGNNDPIQRAWQGFGADILNARNTLRQAESIAHQIIDPVSADTEDVWCENCLHHGVHNPIEKSGLCAACRRYWHRHERHRPASLIHTSDDATG